MAENSPAHDVFNDADPELDADGDTEAVVAETTRSSRSGRRSGLVSE